MRSMPQINGLSPSRPVRARARTPLGRGATPARADDDDAPATTGSVKYGPKLRVAHATLVTPTTDGRETTTTDNDDDDDDDDDNFASIVRAHAHTRAHGTHRFSYNNVDTRCANTRGRISRSSRNW